MNRQVKRPKSPLSRMFVTRSIPVCTMKDPKKNCMYDEHTNGSRTPHQFPNSPRLSLSRLAQVSVSPSPLLRPHLLRRRRRRLMESIATSTEALNCSLIRALKAVRLPLSSLRSTQSKSNSLVQETFALIFLFLFSCTLSDVGYGKIFFKKERSIT